jgi:hypothetical protein
MPDPYKVRDRTYYRMLSDGELIQHCLECNNLTEREIVLLERMQAINDEYLRVVLRADEDY